LDQHLTSARAMRDCAGMSLPWKEKDEVVVVNHNKPVMKVTWHKKGCGWLHVFFWHNTPHPLFSFAETILQHWYLGAIMF